MYNCIFIDLGFFLGEGVVKYILLNLSNRTESSSEDFHVFYKVNPIIGHYVITFIYVS